MVGVERERVAATRVPGSNFRFTPKRERGGGTAFSTEALSENILTRKQHPTALRSCDTNRSCLLRVFPSSPRCLHPAKWARCQSHLQPRGTVAFFFLFNEMTKQQIYICRNRCCNRFDSSWPKTCCVGENGGKRNREGKKSLLATAAWRVFRLWWAFKSTPSALLVARSDNLN